MATSREPLVGVAPTLEDLLRDFLEPLPMASVFDRPEDKLPIGQGDLQHVADAQADGFQDGGGKHDGGRVPESDNWYL
jgi:hypothetical protein